MMSFNLQGNAVRRFIYSESFNLINKEFQVRTSISLIVLFQCYNTVFPIMKQICVGPISLQRTSFKVLNKTRFN